MLEPLKSPFVMPTRSNFAQPHIGCMRLIIILTSLIIHWKAAVIIGAAGRINLLVNVRAQFMTSIIKRRKSSGTAVSSRSTIGLFVFEFD